VPIHPFLADQAFDPATITNMSLANALSLMMIDDAAARLIAQEIIALAEYGIADTLAARVS
jgi:hypothetical protein